MSTKTSRSKSKSPKKASQSVVGDDQIDELIANITLKRPRSGYTHFCMDEIEKFRNKNKNKKFILKEFSKECAAKWAELSDKEKKSTILDLKKIKLNIKMMLPLFVITYSKITMM